MKSITWKGYRMVLPAVGIILGGAIVLGAGLPSLAQSEQTAAGNAIVGTWQVQVSTYSCETGAKAPPFQAFLSFAPGGVLTETTASLAFQPGQRSPGHGFWSYSSASKTYTAISEAFILFSSAPNPPAPGLARGMQRISQVIQVNDDQLAFKATTQFLDENGKVVLSSCADATGAKVK